MRVELLAVMLLQAITEAYDFLTNPNGEPPTTTATFDRACAHIDIAMQALHCHPVFAAILQLGTLLQQQLRKTSFVYGQLTTPLHCCAAPAERMRSSYGASSSAARGGSSSSSSRAYHYNVNTDWSHYETGSTGYTSTISKCDWNLTCLL
jgi:hypothetical protein